MSQKFYVRFISIKIHFCFKILGLILKRNTHLVILYKSNIFCLFNYIMYDIISYDNYYFVYTHLTKSNDSRI